MLKEEHGLSDEELVASICFDVRYQYALRTTQLEEQPVSDRIFSRFRKRIAQFEQETGRNLLDEEMGQLNEVYAGYMQLKEYQLLARVIREQADHKEDGSLCPKDKSEITADSMQNPSDPDAAFRRKAGKEHKGYVLNVVETVGEVSSLVTGISYEPNTYSDSQFCRDYIHNREAVPLEEREPEIMITDGAYGSVDNRKLAEKNKIELVATSLSGKKQIRSLPVSNLTKRGRK